MRKGLCLSIFVWAIMMANNVSAGTATCSDTSCTSGTCGNGCTFSVSNGIMTITGTGEYASISSKAFSPAYGTNGNLLNWNSPKDTRFSGVTSVVITGTISSIGGSAFENNQLNSVTIPNSVTTIGDFAFNLNNLTSVAIPNSVTTIGKAAFQYNSLTSIEIPSSVTTIYNNAFSQNSPASVTIPASVTSIGSFAFVGSNPTELIIASGQLEKYKNGGGQFSNAIHCIDGADACKAVLTALGLTNLLDHVDTYTPPSNTPQPTTTMQQNTDGSYTIKDADGNIIGFRGKRIYTVEEAALVSKDTGNTIKLRYK